MTSRALLLTCSLLLGVVAFPGCDAEFQSTIEHGVSPASSMAPRLRLRISGSLEGYLTPCGCASGLMGGLARRVFRNYLDKRNIDVLIEGGRLVKKAGELELAKLMATLQVLGLDDTKYTAVGLAAVDLSLDKEEAEMYFSAFAPVVASDLLLANGKPWTAGEERHIVAHAFREKKLAHVTARIASLTMSLPTGSAGESFKLLSPSEGWKRAMQGVAPATYRILMVHADKDAIKKLRLTPKPDLIVGVSNDYTEPPIRADKADGVPLVYTGEHGRILLDVTVARGPDGPVVTRHQRVPIKESYSQNSNALGTIQAHRGSVHGDGLLERLANRRPVPGGLKYVGAKKCAECHDADADTCAKHAHSHAWKTLIDSEKQKGWSAAASPTRYPECVSCHVVGYGDQSGFVSAEKTPLLLNVTCENCHGAGSKHVASEDSDDLPWAQPPAKVCTKCHNPEHSPKFDYTSYWPKIEHPK